MLKRHRIELGEFLKVAFGLILLTAANGMVLAADRGSSNLISI